MQITDSARFFFVFSGQKRIRPQGDKKVKKFQLLASPFDSETDWTYLHGR